MEEVVLDVETITPLFIAGADQRNIENEGLRAPSLRGLLRWWFRAIMGGVKFSLGNLNLKSLKEEEEKIWGTTERQSKVFLSVSPVSISLRVSTFHNIRRKGIRYLSYDVNNRPYMDSSSFKIHILFKQPISDEEKKKVMATFWLLLNLGNVGSKSRKGFGSLRITRNLTIDEIEFKNVNNLDELEKYLGNNIKRCLRIFGWDGSEPRNGSLPPYSVIAPHYWKMKILNNTYGSAIDAINSIGEKIREYREDRDNPSAKHTRTTRNGTFSYWVTKDYGAVKSIYIKNPPSTPYGSIFGLPHQFRFQSIDKKAMVKGTEHDRRASPLYIKVWKLSNSKFAIGLQIFKSLFLPENKLRISDRDNSNIKADVDIPLYNYLENFLNGLQGVWVTI